MTAAVRRRGGAGIGRTRVPLRATYLAILVLLYFPIGLLFVFSFSENTLLTFPMEGFTLDWYREVFEDDALLESARNSLIVGVLAATGATLLGFGVSVAVVRFRFRGRTGLVALAGLPLVVPFIVLGVSLFLLFIFVDVPRSLVTVAIGHTVVAIPFATLILLARMGGLDQNLEDAAMDLGATYRTTLRRVVVPLMGPSLLSAWLTCFIVSFDEVAIAIFLAGGDPTFPIFLYGQLRFAQRLPVLIAMAVLLMIGTVTLCLIAFRLGRRRV
ncbi:MAG TPA: ABC transporter permease [Candidatus Limnocylindria bacterium]|nr:ABC transporter permease [Candidatus Limnocylindria bacterium]